MTSTAVSTSACTAVGLELVALCIAGIVALSGL